MTPELQAFRAAFTAALNAGTTGEDVDRVERDFLGRSGKIKDFFRKLPQLSGQERSAAGQELNALREELSSALQQKREGLSSPDEGTEQDPTLPGIRPAAGHAHPLMRFQERVEDIFLSMGYEVVSGPEVEWSSYNFDLLNIPKDHPSRDAWDTFYLAEKGKKGDQLLLRTHTSPVQIRAMEKRKPPVRLIVPGRVFRHEATDASHEAMFYQVEGLVIDRGIRATDLIGTLEAFLKTLFGENVQFRVRPHFYPFTEPSMDIDMRWQGRWLEMGGSGMVHPAVLRNMRVDPSVYSGFAFGMGLDRLMMLSHGIEDVRLSYHGDARFSERLG